VQGESESSLFYCCCWGHLEELLGCGGTDARGLGLVLRHRLAAILTVAGYPERVGLSHGGHDG